MPGRIDVHSHLLPNVDDGCASIDESIACARVLVANGYTHSFCTPHVWPDNVHVRVSSIPALVETLQQHLADAGVDLTLIPGGEMNFRPSFCDSDDDMIVTYAMAGQYALADMWAERFPEHFEPGIRFLQERGLTVILAHPERMRAIQDDPGLADYLADLGVLLQGNLYCFSDPPYSHTRRVAHQFLREDRYFLLGSDLHKLSTIDARLRGIDEAIKTAGREVVDRLMMENPKQLIPAV
jgi:protein-tyrosine phosphatase